LPKPLSDMIVMAVAKDPAQRFQTADAFRNALSQIKESCGSPGVDKAVAAAVTPPPAQLPPNVAKPPTPVSQPAASPSFSSATPASAQTDSALQPNAGPRRPYWILAIAILLLVATLAGARAYRTYKQNAASADAVEAMSHGAAAPSTPTHLLAIKDQISPRRKLTFRSFPLRVPLGPKQQQIRTLHLTNRKHPSEALRQLKPI
jgi:serine/threonine-protein kinase